MTTTPRQSPQQSRIAPQPLPRWERVLSAIAPSLTTVALAFGAPVHPSLRTSRHRQGQGTITARSRPAEASSRL